MSDLPTFLGFKPNLKDLQPFQDLRNFMILFQAPKKRANISPKKNLNVKISQLMDGQPTPPDHVPPPPRNSRPYEGLINQWFPLINSSIVRNLKENLKKTDRIFCHFSDHVAVPKSKCPANDPPKGSYATPALRSDESQIKLYQ